MLPEPFHVCRIICALTRTDFSGMNITRIKWYGWRDSNSHAKWHRNLNPACLPIPPHPYCNPFRTSPPRRIHSSLTLISKVRRIFITAESTQKAQQSQGLTDNPASLHNARRPIYSYWHTLLER